MNVSSRLSLTTTCRGSGCNTATYQWKLNSLVHTVTLTRHMTETDLNLPGIVLKPHRLKSNTYWLIVTVTPNSGPEGKSAYQFTTNMPPYNGYCNAWPYSGQALKTKFFMYCSRWEVKIFGGLHRLLIIQYWNKIWGAVFKSNPCGRGSVTPGKKGLWWKLCLKRFIYKNCLTNGDVW